MAYGNWGAFVYRNGERATQWEDATPYREAELQPGYHQAFLRAAGLNPHHAVLGKDSVRLCGYKHLPALFVDGKKWDIESFVTESRKGYGDSVEPCAYGGTVEGCEFRATLRDNFVDLYLKEPDGTVWTSTCGYEYGAGWMDR